ncbi:MAG: hypothetical protein CMN30_28790 [Sandaracinus sp.]|nr:hypothetical protein [Sandaracinus sp.]|tara:strand:- start:2083 stop:2412 length:330 start_codon:yes stop_codon:yes gene_type:complete
MNRHDEDDALVIRIPGHLLRELLEESTPRPTTGSGDRRQVHDTDDRTWSDGQKRLVYRLVYARGLRGAKARTYIERELGLRSGEAPSMRAASQLIDRLKDDEGGDRGAA